MSVIAVYGSDLLVNRGKQGKLKQDKQGYREICVGAFDTMSEKGDFYTFSKDVKNMFEPGGAVHRRLVRGNLRGELEHPSPVPGESMPAFIARAGQISLQKQSHHFKSVRLETMKDEEGKNIIGCMALVKPSGPFAAATELAFNNLEENVNFSIRTMTRRWEEHNRVNKEVTHIITWDRVDEPGILQAGKFDTPSMESLIELPFTAAELDAAERNSNELAKAIGFESDNSLDYTMLRTSMGWEKVQVVGPRHPSNW